MTTRGGHATRWTALVQGARDADVDDVAVGVHALAHKVPNGQVVDTWGGFNKQGGERGVSHPS